MLRRKAYKFRLKTNPEIRHRLVRQAGACRFVYNKLLILNQTRFQAAAVGLARPRIPERVAHGLLRLWKQSSEYDWLKEADSQVLQQAVRDLERAYRNWFEGRARRPTPRKKYRHDSLRYPQRVKVTGDQVYLPKVGWVRFHQSQPIEGTLKMVTARRSGQHWFVSLQVEERLPDPVHRSRTMVGVDLGVARFATLSDGTVYPALNALGCSQARLARAQQKLAHKEKYSNNWKKQKANISRLHRKVAHRRQNSLHKVSTEISQNHAVIAVENLGVRRMSKSARGTLEDPGRQVAQKSGLNRAILDQGWSRFRSMLAYKQQWRGGELILVPAAHTSQRCHHCGNVDRDNRPAQHLFSCVACGHTDHADLNAARNILAAGLPER